jgi:predicted nucleic acid-binding protein
MDTSAFVKLVVPEPETEALALTPEDRMVASSVLEVETLRAVRRAKGAEGLENARRQLAGVGLLPLTAKVRGRVGELEPDTLRSLDAIHLASALSLGERLDCLYAYDTRMIAVAQTQGLSICAPRVESSG